MSPKLSSSIPKGIVGEINWHISASKVVNIMPLKFLDCLIIIIIIIIFQCYFSGEHIALSIKKQQRGEHRIRKNQQIKSTVHDANQYMK